MPDFSHPHIIAAIRTYRKERNLGYEEARDLAIREFEKRGWDVPAAIRRLYGRSSREGTYFARL